jgi:pimeloyl-ACP methyl ester carboxylesterase
MRGRGRSGRSTDAKEYEFERLIDDVDRLLRQEAVKRAVLLGTALGAHISMRLYAQNPRVFAGVVFNDTGPEAAPAKVNTRYASFSGGDERTFEEALAMIRAQNEATFTRYGDAEFEKMTRRAYRQTVSGAWVRDFDQLTNSDIPRVRATYPDFWSEYRAIDVPIAILRGENSDFLPEDLAKRMLAQNPHATLYTIAGCGHPPMLWEPESFAAVDAFLARVDAKERKFNGAA